MNRIGFKGLLFVIAIAVNFGLPATMIYQQVKILKVGELVKFRTRPIDPYDPFRGRYVQLAFENSEVPIAEGMDVAHGDSIFVSLSVDDEGYAILEKAFLEAPQSGLFLKVKAGWVRNDNLVNMQYPFTRYYMNEEIAPDAERAYREANRVNRELPVDGTLFLDENYAEVRILNGKAALEAVYLGGKPIEEYVKAFLREH